VNLPFESVLKEDEKLLLLLPLSLSPKKWNSHLQKVVEGGLVWSSWGSLVGSPRSLHINWGDESRWTALHLAALYNHLEIVKLLLAHPAIDVNLQDSSQATPFLQSCLNGHLSIVQILLKDPRVDITLPEDHHCTPLWFASRFGHGHVIWCLIASGRDHLGDVTLKGTANDGKEFTALEIAREENKMGGGGAAGTIHGEPRADTGGCSPWDWTGWFITLWQRKS